MRFCSPGIVALTLFFCGAPVLPALAENLAPRAAETATTGLERDLLEDAADGEFHRFTLAGAALVAGGQCDAEELAHTERTLRHKLSVCATAAQGVADPEARGQLALALAYTQFLTGKYRPECTELQVTLSTGDYNCVTASVLYLAVCQELGVRATAWMTPGHVFVRVAAAGPHTATLAKPSPGGQPLASEGATSGPCRQITPVELVGKIYYNRAVAALEAKSYAAAVRCLRLSLELDGHDTAARENLLAALNNWALAQCDAGNYAAAAEALAEARDLNAQWPPLLVNDVHVHQRWAAALCREGRYEEAIELLARCSDRRPDTRLFAQARGAVERTAAAHAGP